jgi:hypothetical protein
MVSFATQAPARQTCPAGHAVPFRTGTSVSVQPVAGVQTREPTSQGFAGTHAAPATQAPQVPEMHAWPPPQAVPSLRRTPVSAQDGVGEQTSEPTWQGVLAGTQSAPATQAAQAPERHAWPEPPQAEPSGSEVPVSVQAGAGEQASVPVWQGFAGTQLAPAVQAEQAPPRHAPPTPQAVPSGAAAVSLHTGPPVSQEMAAAVWQNEGRHAVPAAEGQVLKSQVAVAVLPPPQSETILPER